jgi:hypothetical protein
MAGGSAICPSRVARGITGFGTLLQRVQNGLAIAFNRVGPILAAYNRLPERRQAIDLRRGLSMTSPFQRVIAPVTTFQAQPAFAFRLAC